MTGQRVLAGLVLMSVFSLGAAVGIFFDRHHARPDPHRLSGAEVHEAAMAEMREVLDLDDAQIEGIHAIMANRQEEVQRAWEQLRPELQRAMTDVHSEIAELLRPEQVARFHEWLESRRREAEGTGQEVIIIPH